MPSEIDVQFHTDQIRDNGYTVIERALPIWSTD
jgi:hypothetical protein